MFLSIAHSLDWGKHYYLLLSYDDDTHELSGYIGGPPRTTGRVEEHLGKLLNITANGETCPLEFYTTLAVNNKNPTRAFRKIIQPDADGKTDIEIRMGGSEDKEGELFGRYQIGKHSFENREVKQCLTIFETRMLANERPYSWLPYERHVPKGPPQRTDLHTHSSAQISTASLIQIGVRHHIPYPTRLLKMLHIEYPKEKIVTTRRFLFPPTDGRNPEAIPKTEDAVDIADLSLNSRLLLAASLAVPADRQMTFGDIEQSVYCYRYPITKHPDAAYDMWLEVAQDYKKQGIEYAEITAVSTSFLTPENLKFLHDALPRIEEATKDPNDPNDKGVKLRFLAGIPRNLPPAALHNEIEKLKTMGASPYIVGVDFMGFEDNKIADMEPYIKSIAKWAVEDGNDPDFTLRIHAGENRKNIFNVFESLKMAEECKMRVRIGHAAHGLDAEAISKAKELEQANPKKGRVMIEFNPDSNMALNNIDLANELKILDCLKAKVPFVACSDGGGLYQTDAQQLRTTVSFVTAGEKEPGIAAQKIQSWIAQSEDDHMQLEEKRFLWKSGRLPNDFFERIEHIPTVPAPAIATAAPYDTDNSDFKHYLQTQGIKFIDPGNITAAMEGKKPLMILGATGKRYWDMIGENNKKHQDNIKNVIETLVEELDPAKVYFMVGRPKPEGITPLLSQAVDKYNLTHPQKFSLISATVQADQTAHSFTQGLTHVMPLTGSLFTVPNQLVDFVKNNEGHLLCIGGGTFVRDAILVARDRETSFGLMDGPKGASTEKAALMDPGRLFTNAENLITHLQVAQPEWFKPPVRQR